MRAYQTTTTPTLFPTDVGDRDFKPEKPPAGLREVRVLDSIAAFHLQHDHGAIAVRRFS
jgi:hypothetical protein